MSFIKSAVGNIAFFIGANTLLFGFLLNEGFFNQDYYIGKTGYYIIIGVAIQIAFAITLFIVQLSWKPFFKIFIRGFVYTIESIAKIILYIGERLPGIVSKGANISGDLIKRSTEEGARLSEDLLNKTSKGVKSSEKFIKKAKSEIDAKQKTMNKTQRIFFLIFTFSFILSIITTIAFVSIGPFEGGLLYRYNNMSYGHIQMTGAAIDKTNWAGIIFFTLSLFSLVGAYLFKDKDA